MYWLMEGSATLKTTERCSGQRALIWFVKIMCVREMMSVGVSVCVCVCCLPLMTAAGSQTESLEIFQQHPQALWAAQTPPASRTGTLTCNKWHGRCGNFGLYRQISTTVKWFSFCLFVMLNVCRRELINVRKLCCASASDKVFLWLEKKNKRLF